MQKYDHGGNIHKALREKTISGKELFDFSANINPAGPPEWLRPLVSRGLDMVTHYPDPEYKSLIQSISVSIGSDPEKIVVGNGTTELLYTFLRVIPARRVVIPVPSYVDYVRASEIAQKDTHFFQIFEKDDFTPDLAALSDQLRPEDQVILATPNNPTGISPDQKQLRKLIDKHPNVHFLIDEAFLDFVTGASSLAGFAENVSVLNSMTKFYGIPGLRLGYGVFPEKIAIKMRENLPPWSVNFLAAEVGAMALQDEEYKTSSRLLCEQLREQLVEGLKQINGVKVYPSDGNYLFIKLLSGDSESLASHCRQNGILIRKCDNYQGLEDSSAFVRVAVRTNKENLQLLETFQSYFNKTKGNIATSKGFKKTPAIMFQGTCSDAGKSIITAALCRILFQDGYKVAPFKAQNMSLNSFVTLQGDEMGRAQVVQAQAAKIDPDCRMNPVLLKPNSDTGSQIIVNGQPVGNMSVIEYTKYKPTIWGSICDTYNSLAQEYDVVVLEGAGSPGEVNLKADDIVNMKMAQYAESPVILVGDIDRGGVYASFVGIMEVLAQWERDLVSGFLVNKFRGQASLLDSAHDYVLDHTGRKVFGVVPYLANLGLPEEDSVSFKKGSFNVQREGDSVEIAVINLPHISNFTDVEPFLEEPDVSLTIIDHLEQLQQPDCIILPGSKNVISDLQYLLNKGFAEPMKKCIENGCEVVGICGGYQMLGKVIEDPYQIESTLGEIGALGYLNMTTVIEKDKNLIRKSGIHNISGLSVFGYEIHHGISSAGSEPLLTFEDGSNCGSFDPGKKIWGSYLHGIFDSDEYRRWFIDGLRQKKGLAGLGQIVAPYDLEQAFDRLATTVRENVDIKSLYQLIGL